MTTILPKDCSCVQERDVSRPALILVVAKTAEEVTSVKQPRNSPSLLLYQARDLQEGNCVRISSQKGELQTIADLICVPAAPLNLANSPSLHLLTPEEQTLCSQLRILPKPYLVIKETLVREYARRGGKLRRREARDLVKIDVNKTSRVWDFLVQAGFMKVGTTDPTQSTHDTSA